MLAGDALGMELHADARASVLCCTPMIRPSSVSAVTSSTAGSVARSTISE